jgi:hypothetical protein
MRSFHNAPIFVSGSNPENFAKSRNRGSSVKKFKFKESQIPKKETYLGYEEVMRDKAKRATFQASKNKARRKGQGGGLPPPFPSSCH